MQDLELKIASERERILRDISFAKLIKIAGAEARDREQAAHKLRFLYQRLHTLDLRQRIAQKRQAALLKMYAYGVVSGVLFVWYGLPALQWLICR